MGEMRVVSYSNLNPPPSSCIVVADNDDRNAIKGVIWGVVGLKCATATITCAGLTLSTIPLALFPPFAVVPLVCGVATGIFGSMTGTCINNCSYHFGDRNIKVIQVREIQVVKEAG